MIAAIWLNLMSLLHARTHVQECVYHIAAGRDCAFKLEMRYITTSSITMTSLALNIMFTYPKLSLVYSYSYLRYLPARTGCTIIASQIHIKAI